MYALRNRWSASGTRPVTSAANQATRTAKRTAIDHSRIQTMWGIAEKETKKDGEPRPVEVVGHDHADGMVRQHRVRLSELRVRGRIARREQEEVRARLRRVAERERHEVAQAARRASANEDREPGEQGGRGCDTADRRDVPPVRLIAATRRRRPRSLARRAAREPAAERGREQERWKREDDPEEASPAALMDRRVDLHVDRIVLLHPEPRIRVRCEEHIRAHLGRIADVRRDEVVRARGHLALDEHCEPVHEGDEERGNSAQRHPDDERDREEEPEEHGDTRPLEVVADDESDRPVLSARHARILPHKRDVCVTRSLGVQP